MNEILIPIIYGVLGGIIRTLVDLLRLKEEKRKITNQGFIFYAMVLLFVGAFSGIILGYNKPLSFLGGYAGLDLMDGYYNHF